MSQEAGKDAGRAQIRSVVEEAAASLSGILEKEVPSDLTPEQAERLRALLLSTLHREADQGVRRVCRAFLEEEHRRAKALRKKEAKAEAGGHVERLSLHLRAQHLVLFTSCILLIVTGLPIKFHEAAFSKWFMDVMGGPSVTGILHRIGAVLLTAVGGYHIFYTISSAAGRKDFGLLLPKLQDIKDFLHQVRYFLGLEKDRPLFGRFSYIEKFDYWAVYWGMVVMITSGFILWFKDDAINRFGKVVYDIGREAHSDEALLATLAIVIWHFYNVHFNPKRFPGSLTFWNGRITLEEFKEEHALEYEEWVREGRLPAEGPGSVGRGGGEG
ncbi:MAG: formate dehydrogenase subunit gamma [Acidobacteriota bacterium]